MGYRPPDNLNDIQLNYTLPDYTIKSKNYDAINKIQIQMVDDIQRCLHDGVFYYRTYDEYADNINRSWIMSINAFTPDQVHKI
jgi:hypothetical protein